MFSDSLNTWFSLTIRLIPWTLTRSSQTIHNSKIIIIMVSPFQGYIIAPVTYAQGLTPLPVLSSPRRGLDYAHRVKLRIRH